MSEKSEAPVKRARRTYKPKVSEPTPDPLPVKVVKEENGVTLPVYRPQPVSQIDKLIEMALDKNLDLDRLEKLLAMKREDDAEKAKRIYLQSFTTFQQSVSVMVKNRNVSYDHKDKQGSTNYNYIDLAGIESHIKSALAACGLSYNWTQQEKDGEIIVTCSLRHVNGHVETGFPLSGKADSSSGSKNAIQQKASTITYLKRYTLIGILGLSSAEDDDDGQGGARAVRPSEAASSSSKVKFDDAKMNTAVEMILAGTKTLEQIKEQADLTPEQDSALQKVEENYLSTHGAKKFVNPVK